MRKTLHQGKLKVRAISGTYVVFLAFDMTESDCKGLMGFAIRRTDLDRNESEYLRGNKTFPAIRPADTVGEVRSLEHPFQAFQWADYAVLPGKRYRYEISAMYGQPGNLAAKFTTSINIDTEAQDDGKHGVYFNRAAIASQEFSRRFSGMSVSQAGDPAYRWLARDLVEGLVKFIERAKDANYTLHVAIYEIGLALPLDALVAAKRRGVKLKIVYHAKPDDRQTEENEEMLRDAGLRSISVGRTNINLMHNKFIVLSRRSRPIAVLTGSCNWSRNAFYGQLNVNHSVTDGATAKAYLEYWQTLAADPVTDDVKDWADAENPIPPNRALRPIEPMFSPRRGKAMMDWWKTLANVGTPVFMTFPFGMGKDFQTVYDQSDGILRFALLDKFGNGASKAAAEVALTAIRQYPNIGLSVAPRDKTTMVDRFDGWLRESAAIGVNVNWVHTKFMLVDPLGSNPTTVTGSANWSTNSVNTNDENMIAVFSNQRVADIYFGEFMRLFAHHRFRESVAWYAQQQGTSGSAWKPRDLFTDWRKWVPDHFKSGSEKDIKRRYFAG
jgi:hypothetical protein